MALEIGLWRADGGKLTRLSPSGVGLESQLEDYIEADPALMGQRLLLVGRQVPTAHGGFNDLLAVDGEGIVHVLELKRDRTPRDVVAQALDYGSWVAGLSRADIVSIFANYRPGLAFEEAFAEEFGEEFGEAPPEELNATQILTIVAASVDPATERIVRFLNEGFAVPVNVVFFRHFEDQGSSYLARTWLVDQEAQVVSAASTKVSKSREPWNGYDWYVSFGEFPDGRSWEDAARYGFVSAGGGEWFSRTLKALPIGARVLSASPSADTSASARSRAKRCLSIRPRCRSMAPPPVSPISRSRAPIGTARAGTPRNPGYVVPVDWHSTKTREQAFWKQGMFANQNSACRLRSQFTIEQLAAFFGIED